MQCGQCGNDKPQEMMGHEITDVYDGVLFWQCLRCGWSFPREHELPERNARAQVFADAMNLMVIAEMAAMLKATEASQ